MSRATLIAFLVLVGLSQRMSADDLFQFRPAWRGQQGTTYQQWTFDDDDNPAAPESILNAYGTASADITVKENGAGWQESLITAPERTGVWVDLDAVSLTVDNSPDALPYKEVWIQVTYYEGSAHPPEVVIDSAELLHTTSEDVGPTDPMGNSWIVQHSRWRIEPNPSHEVVSLTPSSGPFGMTIDQIVVDTICFAGAGAGDFDHDGDVDLVDFNIFGQAFSGDGTPTHYFEADLDGDDDCDLQDYVIFLPNFVGPQ